MRRDAWDELLAQEISLVLGTPRKERQMEDEKRWPDARLERRSGKRILRLVHSSESPDAPGCEYERYLPESEVRERLLSDESLVEILDVLGDRGWHAAFEDLALADDLDAVIAHAKTTLRLGLLAGLEKVGLSQSLESE